LFKRLPLAVAALAFVPALAFAHGPSRQKVIETIEINAPAEKVWARVGNFNDMSWHPAVAQTDAKGGNEVGATRALTLKGDKKGPIEEELLKYDAAGFTYSYKISQVDVKVLPVNNYSSHITVTPEDGGKSKVEWWGAFYRGFPNNDPPPELNDEAAFAAVTAVYKTGLDGLKKAVEGGK